MASPLSRDSIATNLATELVGRDVVVYKSTASTNDLAWRYAGDAAKNGLAIFTETQTAGRGRRGNKWLGGQSQSLLCSILLLDVHLCADMVTLAAGVAVAEAIGTCGRQTARLKWPNDVVLEGRKVAGILIESRSSSGRTAYVIGIGINCCQSPQDFPAEIGESTTSIELASGYPCDRNSLARRLLTGLDEWLAKAGKEPDTVTETWLGLSNQLNHRLTLQHDNRTYVGNCVGVDPQKGLILRLDGGALMMFNASQTHTVRPA
jgi:BirA family transcriptional regulator, biotin operon repressor / biotin---[acetyl-CoA-carboxylase] ligase